MGGGAELEGSEGGGNAGAHRGEGAGSMPLPEKEVVGGGSAYEFSATVR